MDPLTSLPGKRITAWESIVLSIVNGSVKNVFGFSAIFATSLSVLYVALLFIGHTGFLMVSCPC